jgi:hypothetical protein
MAAKVHEDGGDDLIRMMPMKSEHIPHETQYEAKMILLGFVTVQFRKISESVIQVESFEVNVRRLCRPGQ